MQSSAAIAFPSIASVIYSSISLKRNLGLLHELCEMFQRKERFLTLFYFLSPIVAVFLNKRRLSKS